MCLCDAFCRFDLLWNLRRREATVEIPFAVSEDGRQGFVYADKLFFNRECVLTVSDIYSEKYYISDFFVYNKLDESILEKYIGYFDPLCQFEMIVTNKIPESWWIKFVENESVIKKLVCSFRSH